ncbi:MAG: hypothetical protein RIB98_18820 [Acidimicrobiales bacterium]
MAERSEEEFAYLAAAEEASKGWDARRAGSKDAKVADLIEGGETSRGARVDNCQGDAVRQGRGRAAVKASDRKFSICMRRSTTEEVSTSGANTAVDRQQAVCEKLINERTEEGDRSSRRRRRTQQSVAATVMRFGRIGTNSSKTSTRRRSTPLWHGEPIRLVLATPASRPRR